MDTDIQGALNQLDRSYKCFEHNGLPMTKANVKKVLEYGLSKGYEVLSQITSDELNTLLNE